MNKIQLILILAGALCFSSCKKEDNSSARINEVKTAMQSGSWRITLYSDDGQNETSYFSGYSFSFQNNGTLSANNGSATESGTWSVRNSNSNDDSNDDLDFIILFNSSNNFEELNDDWDIVSNTATRIELKDVSGGNGTTDLLIFEKM